MSDSKPAHSNDIKCKCGHWRSAHSVKGCGEIVDWNTGKECSCKKKFTKFF